MKRGVGEVAADTIMFAQTIVKLKTARDRGDGLALTNDEIKVLLETIAFIAREAKEKRNAGS